VTDTDGNGAAITLRDVWQAVQQTNSTVAQGNVTLATIMGRLDAQDTHSGAVDRALIDYEQRLRALERWRYALPTATLLGVGSAVLGVLGFLHH
jgi:hypothetical protein